MYKQNQKGLITKSPKLLSLQILNLAYSASRSSLRKDFTKLNPYGYKNECLKIVQKVIKPNLNFIQSINRITPETSVHFSKLHNSSACIIILNWRLIWKPMIILKSQVSFSTDFSCTLLPERSVKEKQITPKLMCKKF